ncbi:MAG: hypothetical protein C4339_01545 [Nitrososphaerota archaeon]
MSSPYEEYLERRIKEREALLDGPESSVGRARRQELEKELAFLKAELERYRKGLKALRREEG